MAIAYSTWFIEFVDVNRGSTNPRSRFRALHRGLTGDDVAAWQQFLIDRGALDGAETGSFDDATHEITLTFQRTQALKEDGWFGNQTMGRAPQLGYDAVDQGDMSHAPNCVIAGDEDGPGWPSPPSDLSLRRGILGDIKYTPRLGND